MDIRDSTHIPFQFNSDSRAELLAELESLHSQGSLNLFSKIAHKIYGFISHFFKEPRHFEALRTQEHLFNEGSYIDAHQKALTNALEKKSGEGFNQLLHELQEMAMQNAWKASHRFFGEFSQDFPQELKSKLNTLKDKESLWIDAGTNKGEHSMVMRLTKKIESGRTTYDLQFSNTGAGIKSNPDFHPPLEEGKKTIYQTVALIIDIPEDKIINSRFFERYFKIAETGRDLTFSPASQENHETITTNSYDPIDDLYGVLRELGQPINLNHKNLDTDARYFSRKQLGGSCSISSIWAMAKTLLSKEELLELKTDMRLSSLLRNYREIKNEYDNSSTSKILVLDQIQKLQNICKKHHVEAPRVLSQIEQELLKELNMIHVESKISKKGRYTIKEGLNRIPLMDISLIPREYTLKADVEFKVLEENSIDYEIKDNQGVDLFDQTYLLILSVANGDQKNSEIHLNKVLSSIKEYAKKEKAIPHEKARQTAKLLYNLTMELNKLDNTRSGIAKKMFLIDLSSYYMSIAYPKNTLDSEVEALKKQIENEKASMLSIYKTMNVKFYLPKDHMWVQALKSLKT